MAERGQMTDVRVGIFVLAALAVLIGGSLWVAGRGYFGAGRVSYTVLMTDSGGIQAGDRVRMAGVPVGRVQHVRLRAGDEWPVRLAVAIDADIPVRRDSAARMASSGLLGASFLEILPGSADAELLPPGGEIRGRSDPGLEETLMHVDEISEKVLALLDQTGSLLDEVSSEIGPILDRVERLMSDTNVDSVTRMLATLTSTAEDLQPRLNALLERLDRVAGQAESAASEIPELAERLGDLAADLHAALGPDGERLVNVLDAARSGLESADDTLDVLVDNRREIDATLRDLRRTVANLKAFSQEVKERPFSLVRIVPQPDRRPGEGVK